MIYLIICGECGLQYVGKTSQCLHQCLNGHKSAVSSDIKTCLCNHFNEVGYAFSSCSIQIIDSVNVNDFDNKECNVERGRPEDFWISILCVISPLGLNDRVQGTGSVSQGNVFGK